MVDRGGRHDQMWRPLSLEVNFHPHDSFDKQVMMVDDGSRLPCYVFCICLLTTGVATANSINKYQKYKSVELGDQLGYTKDDDLHHDDDRIVHK